MTERADQFDEADHLAGVDSVTGESADDATTSVSDATVNQPGGDAAGQES